ncbi:MAG: glycosyltransferase [Lachnospiraceae bacterium]|nr:glycosyltransferase [Lachnospiraceae bacterium]
MIFVTVGTHEQPFNRLVEYVDKLKEKKVINEEVVIQTGFSTYEPRNCAWKQLFPYQDMVKYVEEARIVITHGGPSSFIMPLQIGKIPIVVPRQKQFNEHVNNHQVEFVKAVAEKQGNIIAVEDITNLQNVILDYDLIVGTMPSGQNSNNAKFNEEFGRLVNGLFHAK